MASASIADRTRDRSALASREYSPHQPVSICHSLSPSLGQGAGAAAGDITYAPALSH